MGIKQKHERIIKIFDIIEHLTRIYKGLSGAPEKQRLKEARILLKLLTRIAEGNSARYDISEFGQRLHPIRARRGIHASLFAN